MHKYLRPFFTPESVLFQERVSVDSPLYILAKKSAAKFSLDSLREKYHSSLPYLFDDRRYQLIDSSVYNNFSKELKTEILKSLTKHSLITSYFIEKGAVTYCARMALLSKTLEEKSLFLMMGQEEVIHLYEFEKFLSEQEKEMTIASPFILKLNELIQNNDRETSFLVAQILLEGMALGHYKLLQQSCIDPTMQALLAMVIRDEAKHHGSGIVLLDESALSLSDSQLTQFVSITKEVIALIKNQQGSLIQIIKDCYQRICKEQISHALLETLLLEINIEKQMSERVAVIIDGIKKIRNQKLQKILLLELV